MAQQPIEVTPSPYRVIDRRGQNSGWPGWSGFAVTGQSNFLYKGATQSSDRQSVPFLDRDTHRNVTNYGRKTLLSIGRWLYANVPSIGGAIKEQANLATEGFLPQFNGDDFKWGAKAEDWLQEWGRICDVAGSPYDFQSLIWLIVVSQAREGDVGILLADTGDKYPRIQIIPSHRIDSKFNEKIVMTGPYQGNRIIDGVIINDYRCAIGYRIYDEWGLTFQDVPADNLILAFDPEWTDQVRGYSLLSSGIFMSQDLAESKSFELIAQKAAAAIALLETNEGGTADPMRQIIKAPATTATTSAAATVDDYGNKTANAFEKMEGGAIRYFKARRGHDLKAFAYDRPGDSVQRYQDDVMRDIFSGVDLSYFFSVDPSKPGGASMRVVVERVNAAIRKRQRLVQKVARRIHGYAISKAIKLGLLPSSDEWYKWEYQLPAEITADRKYDSDVDLQEIRAGLSTHKRACAKRGEYYQDVFAQRQSEANDILKMAKEFSASYGIDITTALNVIGGLYSASGLQPERPEPTSGGKGKADNFNKKDE